MINNCSVEYFNTVTKTSHVETFHDPYIFNIRGVCHAWNGEQWVPTVSYAGIPIMNNLAFVFPKDQYDPASSGFKRL